MNRALLITYLTLLAPVFLAGQDAASGQADLNLSSTGKPLVQTEIEAETLEAEITEDKGYLIGRGSVKLTATNLEITCNQIEVFTDVKDKDGNDTLGELSSIRRIIAMGNVKIVQEERMATSGRAEVYPNDDYILLDEDPNVYQNDITIDGTGAQMRILRGNGRVELIGDANNKIRVTGRPIEDFGFEENEDTIEPPEEEPAEGSDGNATESPDPESQANADNPQAAEQNDE